MMSISSISITRGFLHTLAMGSRPSFTLRTVLSRTFFTLTSNRILNLTLSTINSNTNTFSINIFLPIRTINHIRNTSTQLRIQSSTIPTIILSQSTFAFTSIRILNKISITIMIRVTYTLTL